MRDSEVDPYKMNGLRKNQCCQVTWYSVDQHNPYPEPRDFELIMVLKVGKFITKS